MFFIDSCFLLVLFTFYFVLVRHSHTRTVPITHHTASKNPPKFDNSLSITLSNHWHSLHLTRCLRVYFVTRLLCSYIRCYINSDISCVYSSCAQLERTMVRAKPAQTDFNFLLIHGVTIGCNRRTSQLLHDYCDYRRTIATIARLSRLSRLPHGYCAHKMITIRDPERLLIKNGEYSLSKK